MINLLPTAKVIFRDGHEEASTSVFIIKNKHYVVCTKSGAYMANDREPIRKYHPEYVTTKLFMNGDVEYDHSNCWLVDDLVENIIVNWGRL